MISVVIPTFRRDTLLKTLLQTLADQQTAAVEFEVIVVDNACSAATRAMVAALDHALPIVYQSERQPGVAFARNKGAACARGDVIAFIDDDVIPGAHWLQAIHVLTESEPQEQIWGGPVAPVNAQLQPIAVPVEFEPCLGVQRYPETEFTLDGSSQRGLISGNLVVRKRTLQEYGGFHPVFQRQGDNIGSVEDHEFFSRMTRCGAAARFTHALRAVTVIPDDRLGDAYIQRWKRGHGYYSAQLEYLLALEGDVRAPIVPAWRVLFPFYYVRSIVGTLRSPSTTRRQRSFMLGYLRGALHLVTSPSARAALRSPPPVIPINTALATTISQ